MSVQIRIEQYERVKTAGTTAVMMKSPEVSGDRQYINELLVRYLAHAHGDKPEHLRGNIAMLCAYSEPREVRMYLMRSPQFPYHKWAMELVNEIEQVFETGLPMTNPHVAAARLEMAKVFPQA